jgi:hypothetical protein
VVTTYAAINTAAGIARPTTAPLVHFAAGVDVEVFALT